MPTLPYSSAGQIALAAILAMAAFYLLLPKPGLRSRVGGTAAAIASLAVFAMWLVQAFGKPSQDAVATVLFALFSVGALVNGVILVAQKNPARGAIAFAFVILSTCGLFLLLAAPFLMAATIIIYAGAIIVTFLFVLMLSNASGPSDENDRSREPLLGSLAGFAFVGLVLFTLYKNAPPAQASETALPPLPVPVLAEMEKSKLSAAVSEFDASIVKLRSLDPKDEPAVEKWYDGVRAAMTQALVADRSAMARLQIRHDTQAGEFRQRVPALEARTATVNRSIQESIDGTRKFDAAVIEKDLTALRDDIRLLYGSAELPARNVANLGVILYADQLLAVELAGTLLLVATIGAVAITNRKGVAG